MSARTKDSQSSAPAPKQRGDQEGRAQRLPRRSRTSGGEAVLR